MKSEKFFLIEGNDFNLLKKKKGEISIKFKLIEKINK